MCSRSSAAACVQRIRITAATCVCRGRPSQFLISNFYFLFFELPLFPRFGASTGLRRSTRLSSAISSSVQNRTPNGKVSSGALILPVLIHVWRDWRDIPARSAASRVMYSFLPSFVFWSCLIILSRSSMVPPPGCRFYIRAAPTRRAFLHHFLAGCGSGTPDIWQWFFSRR